MPALIAAAAIDWGFWGAIATVVGIVVAAAISVVIYFRGKAVKIAVSATFDKTGLVHVLIKKTGMPTVHVRDVKLLRAGTNKTLKIRSRRPAGEFDITAGATAYDCFCLLDGKLSADEGVVVKVWLDEKTTREATATRSEVIKLPDGVRLE